MIIFWLKKPLRLICKISLVFAWRWRGMLYYIQSLCLRFRWWQDRHSTVFWSFFIVTFLLFFIIHLFSICTIIYSVIWYLEQPRLIGLIHSFIQLSLLYWFLIMTLNSYLTLIIIYDLFYTVKATRHSAVLLFRPKLACEVIFIFST